LLLGNLRPVVSLLSEIFSGNKAKNAGALFS